MGKLLCRQEHKYLRDLGLLLFDLSVCHQPLHIPKNDSRLQSFASRDKRVLYAQQHLGHFFVRPINFRRLSLIPLEKFLVQLRWQHLIDQIVL